MKRTRFTTTFLSAALLALAALFAAFGPQALPVFAEEFFLLDEEESEDAGLLADDGDTVLSGTAKPTLSSAKITTCSGYSKGKIRITAKVTTPVKSIDNYYYLFRVNSNTGKLETRVAKTEKAKKGSQKLTFTLNTADHPEYAINMYGLAVKTKKGSKVSCYTRISGARFVNQPEKAAYNKASYKLPKTKKGLQTTDINQLTQTKSQTAFCNLQMSTVMTKGAESVPYVYNGKTYYFSNIGGYQLYVSQCNQKGIQVTMQLMLDWSSATKDVIAASSQQSGVSFYAWNTTNAAAKQKMEAVFSFLAEMFGQSDCYVSNWILGNEVNSCNLWNYPGNMNKTEYVNSYTEAYRCLYNAVRSQRANSKVFICVDHLWNMTTQGYSSRDMIDSFAARLKKLQKDVNWNLAYHAYPFPLTDCRFWNSASDAVYGQFFTNDVNSQVVSLNNLSVMTNYIKSKYGTKTRIILSEQGFTSSQSQDAQAAAIALGYYVAACNPMVDAFIIRSYQDEAHEVAQGLAMGINGKKAMKVFTYMDSTKSLKYTESYLKSQVGSGWKSRVPGFSTSRLSKIYRK
ncbi:MAG: DUF5722 domain-containing protein [Eubacteriales bacterium]|nr:DUF5722 domain-containing protein [Eubacteriales bacterium]